MHDPEGVGVGDPLHHFEEPVDRVREVEPLLAVEDRRQVLPLEVLEDDVGRPVLERPHVEHGRDVLVAKPRRGARLVEEARDVLRPLGEAAEEDLHRDGLLQHLMLGEEYGPHPAAPDLREHDELPADAIAGAGQGLVVDTSLHASSSLLPTKNRHTAPRRLPGASFGRASTRAKSPKYAGAHAIALQISTTRTPNASASLTTVESPSSREACTTAALAAIHASASARVVRPTKRTFPPLARPSASRAARSGPSPTTTRARPCAAAQAIAASARFEAMRRATHTANSPPIAARFAAIASSLGRGTSIAHGSTFATRAIRAATAAGTASSSDSRRGPETNCQTSALAAIRAATYARTGPGRAVRRRTSPPCDTTRSRGPRPIAIGHALGSAQCATTSSNLPSSTRLRARATHAAPSTSRSGDSLTRAAIPGHPNAPLPPRSRRPPRLLPRSPRCARARASAATKCPDGSPSKRGQLVVTTAIRTRSFPAPPRSVLSRSAMPLDARQSVVEPIP